MSTAAAISAVTRTLIRVIDAGIDSYRDKHQTGPFALPSNVLITTRPLDKLRDLNAAQPQQCVNLFLYETLINAAWRNLSPPDRVRPGETGHPPLALNLRYLLTPIADTDDNDRPHLLLGVAMSVLHDHAVLTPADFSDADVTESGIAQQPEHIRITPVALTFEDMSKLWTTFQTQYRLSTAFEATVVLIDSARPTKAPLPVLRRGEEDRGVTATAAAAPTITRAVPPRDKPSIELGERLTIHGQGLGDVELDVELARASGGSGESGSIVSASDTELVVQLPSAGAAAANPTWSAGVMTVRLVQRSEGRVLRSSNSFPFALAPRIVVAATGQPSAGTVELTVKIAPYLQPGQRISLLFGERELQIPPPAATTSSVVVTVPDVAPGKYVVRLRVDGVDSVPLLPLPVPPAPAQLPTFDPAQIVVVN